ncbi:MAG TPA: S-layer homology domain-containing protein, partial [Armatimonadota bacterium]|nr:S-layer homology domain-containing protein [Armatimonadota bacterium]
MGAVLQKWVRGILVAVVAMLWAAGARAEEPASGPFRDVPPGHWAYGAMDELARQGYFTGYPDGTFRGTRALTRYEFAVALQRVSGEVQRKEVQEYGGRASVLRLRVMEQVGTVRRTPVESLLKLIAEFRPELAMLGSDVDQMTANTRTVAARRGRDLPAPKPAAEQSAAWKRGVQRAR